MTLPPPLPSAGEPQLSEEHLREVAAAHAGLRKIRRAVAVARFDGWTLGCFAAITLLFSLTSVPGLLLGLGMGAVAVIELRASSALARLDAQAPRTLGLNQLAMATLLTIYALWGIYGEMTGHGQFAAMMASDPEVAQLLQPTADLTRLLSLGVYAAMIAIAVLAQGSLALFYFSRTKLLRTYLAQTPSWIIGLQRAGAFN